MVEGALPVLLEAALGDEDHIRILEALHVAAEVAAIPRRLHGLDHRENRLLVRGGIGCGRRAGAGGEEEKQSEQEAGHLQGSGGRRQLTVALRLAIRDRLFPPRLSVRSSRSVRYEASVLCDGWMNALAVDAL
jgi:hypothetical protein